MPARYRFDQRDARAERHHLIVAKIAGTPRREERQGSPQAAAAGYEAGTSTYLTGTTYSYTGKPQQYALATNGNPTTWHTDTYQ